MIRVTPFLVWQLSPGSTLLQLFGRLGGLQKFFYMLVTFAISFTLSRIDHN